jgi:hypothetical protein
MPLVTHVEDMEEDYRMVYPITHVEEKGEE